MFKYYCSKSRLLHLISEHYCCNIFILTQHTRGSTNHSCVQARTKRMKKRFAEQFRSLTLKKKNLIADFLIFTCLVVLGPKTLQKVGLLKGSPLLL